MGELQFSDEIRREVGIGLWGCAIVVTLTVLCWAVMIVAATLLVRWAWSLL